MCHEGVMAERKGYRGPMGQDELVTVPKQKPEDNMGISLEPKIQADFH